MDFVKIKPNDKPKYMNFLLIADEEERMVKTYLYRGDMFALRDEALKALCIVTREHPGIYELKNIVTVPAPRFIFVRISCLQMSGHLFGG